MPRLIENYKRERVATYVSKKPQTFNKCGAISG